jgi:phenylpropionate dioxygenase-like ring-hydroxylating dioxygenase large terminal subunit
VFYGAFTTPLPEIPFFEELKQGFSYGSFSETWSVHYTRAIENQLDVVHLPFVHQTPIGRGNKTLVNGPVVTWQDNRMTFYVKNQIDEGQTPQKPDEIADYQSLFSLQLQMPNLWQNRISDKIRIVAAFAPSTKATPTSTCAFTKALPAPRAFATWSTFSATFPTNHPPSGQGRRPHQLPVKTSWHGRKPYPGRSADFGIPQTAPPFANRPPGPAGEKPPPGAGPEKAL